MRALATQADSLAETRPKLALLLAAESAARARADTAEAQNAIVSARVALAQSDIVPNGEPIPVGDALTALVTPDGSTIITGARDGTIRLWDAATGEPRRRSPVSTGGVEEAAVDPSGRWLVAVGRGGAWRWDLTAESTAGEMIARPRGALWSAAFSPDGTRLATAAQDGIVQIYDTGSWRPLGAPFTVFVDFLSVAFTPDGSRLVAGTGTGQVFIWDLARTRVGPPPDRRARHERRVGARDESRRQALCHREQRRHRPCLVARDRRPAGDTIRRPRRTADGARHLRNRVVGERAVAVRGRGRRPGARVEPRDAIRSRDASAVGHDDRITDGAVSRDGRLFVTLGRDQVVRVWDLAPRRPVSPPSTPANRCTAWP